MTTHKMKKFSFGLLGMFLLILMSSFASATLNLELVQVPTSVEHGTTVLVSVNLTATENYTGLNWADSDSVFDLSDLPTTFNTGEQTFTVDLTIPEHQASGLFLNNLVVKQGIATLDTLTVSTTINASKELSVSDATLSEETTTIIIKNEGNVALHGIELTSSTGNFAVNFSTNNFDLAAGDTKSVILTLTSENKDAVGQNTIIITATADEGTIATGTITRGTAFCNGIPELEGLKIKRIDFSNNGYPTGIFGEDEEWYAFEEIEVRVEVDNDGSNDMRDISLEWGLYNTKLEQWVIDVDEEDDFDLDEGEDIDITFSFVLDDDLDIDLEDLTSGDDYRLYVRVIGTFDEGPNEDKETCISNYEEATVIIEEDLITLTDFKPEYTISCGENLEISANIWNIGEDDQDEITLVISSSDLGIEKEVKIDSLDAFENEEITATLEIPENTKAGSYRLNFELFDENGEIYETEKNDIEVSYTVRLIVEGNCQGNSNFEIYAEAGEIKEGKEGTINLVITNTGDSTSTFDLEIATLDWAEDVVINPNLLIIKGGESKEFEIVLTPKKDSAGTHIFELLLNSEGQTEAQPIEVIVSKNSGFLGISGFVIGENPYTTGLTVLIIVLVIIIILILIIKKLKK